MKFVAIPAVALLTSFFAVGCGEPTSARIKDSGHLLATLHFTSAHEFLAEYDREIILHSQGESKTLQFPPDSGGDLPITVSRHTGDQKDFLHFQGGIYTLVFDLNALDYAEGSDRPEDEIYTGKYSGPTLPPVSATWTVDSKHRVTRTR